MIGGNNLDSCRWDVLDSRKRRVESKLGQGVGMWTIWRWENGGRGLSPQ